MILVILLEKVNNLGDIGQKVYVKSGYARNFLIPMAKAVLATKKNIDFLKFQSASLESNLMKKKYEAELLISKIKELGFITITVKSGVSGKLFGSIGAREIVAALMKEGIHISKHHVRFPDGKKIRNLGDYDIIIQIFNDMYSTLRVCVISIK